MKSIKEKAIEIFPRHYYIRENTKNNANISITYNTDKGISSHSQPWLTPDQARRAVEIAREEMIEKICEYLGPKIWAMNMGYQKFTDECIEDFKQAMKDE